MRFLHALSLVAGVTAGCLASSAGAATLVTASSTFDSDVDGWIGDNVGEFVWMASGGNPDGYLHFDDIAPAGGAAIAPAKFRGDWSALDGVGSIRYDHSVLNAGTHTSVGAQVIFLSGPGGDARWDGPLPCTEQNCMTAWQTFTAPLVESAWTITGGSWAALLADVNSMVIRGDHYTSVSIPTANQEALDNIVVGPGPASTPLPGLDGSTLLAYPNPFNHRTRIEYAAGSRSHATIRVFGVGGRLVRTLVDEPLGPGAGSRAVVWDGRDRAGAPVPAGVYLVLLDVGGNVRSEKVLRLR